MRIFESKTVIISGLTKRLSKMIGSNQSRPLSEWIDKIGHTNVELAIETGILSEVVTESSDLVSMDGVMKNGDYVVFHGDDGYIMYHVSDGQMWRTTGNQEKDLNIENAKEVSGIAIGDGSKRVVMSGHETPPAPPSPGIPQEIETEIEELPELEIEMPPAEIQSEIPAVPEIPLEPEAQMAPEPAMSFEERIDRINMLSESELYHHQLPELEEIDYQIRRCESRIAREMMIGQEELRMQIHTDATADRITALRQKIEELKSLRAKTKAELAIKARDDFDNYREPIEDWDL